MKSQTDVLTFDEVKYTAQVVKQTRWSQAVLRLLEFIKRHWTHCTNKRTSSITEFLDKLLSLVWWTTKQKPQNNFWPSAEDK